MGEFWEGWRVVGWLEGLLDSWRGVVGCWEGLLDSWRGCRGGGGVKLDSWRAVAGRGGVAGLLEFLWGGGRKGALNLQRG